MLHTLGGGSPKSASDYYGKKITGAELVGDEFRLKFDDGVEIKIWDDSQSCCESRYMTCDDEPRDLVGQKLVSIEVKEGAAPENDDEWGEHEIAFLEIQGDKSSIQFATHNEHNGYYGGFGLSLDEVK